MFGMFEVLKRCLSLQLIQTRIEKSRVITVERESCSAPICYERVVKTNWECLSFPYRFPTKLSENSRYELDKLKQHLELPSIMILVWSTFYAVRNMGLSESFSTKYSRLRHQQDDSNGGQGISLQRVS